MVSLVLVTESFEYGYRLLLRRFADHDGLETSFKRCILFYVFSVLVERGCADYLEITSCKARFQNISGVRAALR